MPKRPTYVTRIGPAIDIVRINLRIDGSTPALRQWAWERPYASQNVVRIALQRALESGLLEQIEKELAGHDADA